MPAKAANVPRVAMIGLTFRTVTIKPLTTPQSMPATMPISTAKKTLPTGGKLNALNAPTKKEAAMTEPIEAMEPTEISSAPAMMTTVSPMASKTDDHDRRSQTVHQVLPG